MELQTVFFKLYYNEAKLKTFYKIFSDWKFYLNMAGSELPMMPIEKLSQTLENATESLVAG